MIYVVRPFPGRCGCQRLGTTVLVLAAGGRIAGPLGSGMINLRWDRCSLTCRRPMVRSLTPSVSLWHGIWSFPFVCFSLEECCDLCTACFPFSVTLAYFGSAPVGRRWSIWYVFQFQQSQRQEAEIAAYSKQDFQHLWPKIFSKNGRTTQGMICWLKLTMKYGGTGSNMEQQIKLTKWAWTFHHPL